MGKIRDMQIVGTYDLIKSSEFEKLGHQLRPVATLRILLWLQLHPQCGILHPQSLVCTPNVFLLLKDDNSF